MFPDKYLFHYNKLHNSTSLLSDLQWLVNSIRNSDFITFTSIITLDGTQLERLYPVHKALAFMGYSRSGW